MKQISATALKNLPPFISIGDKIVLTIIEKIVSTSETIYDHIYEWETGEKLETIVLSIIVINETTGKRIPNHFISQHRYKLSELFHKNS